MTFRSFLVRSLQIAGIASGIYFAIVGLTAIDIYKNRLTNDWTAAVERVFPFPAAIVDREIIPLSRFRKEVAARQNVATKNNLKTPKNEIESTVVDRLVNSALYEEALRKESITVTDSDVDKTLENVYAQIKGKENLDKFLREEYGSNMSLEDFRILTREFLVQSAIEKQVLVHATVHHILIAIPENATPEQVEAGRLRAEDVKKKITEPGKFAEIAKKYSEDLGSRDKGGELGTAPRGEIADNFSTDFENAVFTLPVGEVSGAIRSKHGWHIIIVDKREGKVDKSLDQYTDSLHAEAKIKVFIGK